MATQAELMQALRAADAAGDTAGAARLAQLISQSGDAPRPNPTGLDAMLVQNIQENKPPPDGKNPLEQFAAGFNMSASGLMLNKSPNVAPENAPLLSRLTRAAGQQLGDLPFNVVGAFGGAAAGAAIPVADATGIPEVALGGAGAMALPEAVRSTYVENIRRGKVTSWHDVLERAQTVTIATGKAAMIGMIAGPAGKYASTGAKLVTGSASAALAADVGAQTVAATTAGAAMDGHVPDAQDFATNAILMLGVHGAVVVGGKIVPSRAHQQVADHMQQIYAKTGVPPWEQVERAKSDPQLRQEILQQDPDGDPVAPKFAAGKAPDPLPYKPPVTLAEPGSGGVQAAQAPDTLKMLAYAENTAAYAKAHSLNEADVISYAGAIGKYQITPDTARTYMGPQFDVKTLRDPAVNEKVAGIIASHLESKYKLPDGTPDKEAIAIAYHSGPGKANEFIRKGRDFSVLGPKAQRYLERIENGGFLKPREPSAEELASGGGQPPKEPPAGGGGGEDFSGATPEELGATIMQGVAEPDAPGLLSKFKSAADKAYDDFVNQRGEARRLDAAAGADGTPLEDAFQSLNASRSRADYFMTKGSILDPHTFAEGDAPAYMDAYKAAQKAGGTRDGFLQYRLARQAIADSERGLDTAVNVEAAKAYVEKTSKLYEEPDRMVNRSKNAALDYAARSGLYSADQVQAFKENNPSHIVQRRDIGDTSVPASFGKRGVKPSQVKAKTGSERKIVSPQHADIENLANVIAAADKNVALRKLVEGRGDSELGALGIRKTGVEPGELPVADGEALGKFLEPVAKPKEAGDGPRSKNDFDVFFDGKRHTFTIQDNPELARMIHGATPVEVDAITRAASTFAAVKRSGVTDTIDFLSRAVFRDQITASILNEHGGVPFQHLIAGTYHALRMDKIAQEYARAGGYGAALAEMDANYFQRHIDKVFGETGTWDSVANVVKTPLHAMQVVATRVDALTRMGRYAQLRRMGAEPLHAAMDSRRFTLDFATRGASQTMNIMAKMTTFLRPSVLGHDQLVRAFLERPATTVAKSALYITLPSVLMYLWNREVDKTLPPEEQYINQPRWLRDLFWLTPPIGGVRIPFPKPFVIGQVFGSMTERMLEWHETHDANSFKDLKDNVLGAASLPLIPTGVAPIAEQAWNFNGINGKPLIPASVAEASGYMQYTPTTSETAIQLARLLGPPGLNAANVSPVVVQNYVREWAGSLGMQVLHTMDMAFEPVNTVHELKDNPFVGGFVTRHTDMGLAPIQDFYDNVAAVKAANKDLKLATERDDPTELAAATNNPLAAIRITTAEAALGKMSAAIRAVRYDKDMNVDEKRQNIEDIYQQMLAAAKDGNDALREINHAGS